MPRRRRQRRQHVRDRVRAGRRRRERAAGVTLSFVSSGTLDPTADHNHPRRPLHRPARQTRRPAAVELQRRGRARPTATISSGAGPNRGAIAVFAAAADPTCRPATRSTRAGLPSGCRPAPRRRRARAVTSSRCRRARRLRAGHGRRHAAVRTRSRGQRRQDRLQLGAAAFGARSCRADHGRARARATQVLPRGPRRRHDDVVSSALRRHARRRRLAPETDDLTAPAGVAFETHGRRRLTSARRRDQPHAAALAVREPSSAASPRSSTARAAGTAACRTAVTRHRPLGDGRRILCTTSTATPRARRTTAAYTC